MRSNLRYAGAGRNFKEANTPAVLEVSGKGRVVVLSLGTVRCGIPVNWAAFDDRPGVNLLKNLSEKSVQQILSLKMILTQIKRFQVQRASQADAQWIRETLNRDGKNLEPALGLTKTMP